jgi:DNA-binding GntR family transcriptional regulator
MARPPVKAQQLADELGAQIRSGELSAGAWLPAERQLAETYVVGRSTVRQAIQMLVDAGLVEALSGAGNRVYGHTTAITVDDSAGAVDDVALVLKELQAIRGELRKVNARLTAIEERGASVRASDR